MTRAVKILRKLSGRRVRAWLYRVATAAGAVAAAYGYVTGEELALWLGLAGAVLGTGTAAAYTPVRRRGTARR